MKNLIKHSALAKGICGLVAAWICCGVSASAWAADDSDRYMVIDLSGGSKAARYGVSYRSAPPAGGWTDEYRTTKLVLRKVNPGTFTMGSPKTELGHDPIREEQHRVTLTRGYYIAVFEVTERQWVLVMGRNPSNRGEMFPVQQVSYQDIRGENLGARWPKSAEVDPGSFSYLMRKKTGLKFDLPTDAQWEYACRAGTTSALNSGKELTRMSGICPVLSEVGRYDYNAGVPGGPAKVGSYKPNAWGLYDMHGNAWEWCLDWFKEGLGPEAATDPAGADVKWSCIVRGGGWTTPAVGCRSAFRYDGTPSYQYYYDYGFRPVCNLGD